MGSSSIRGPEPSSGGGRRRWAYALTYLGWLFWVAGALAAAAGCDASQTGPGTAVDERQDGAVIAP